MVDEIGGWGTIPTLESLGLSVAKLGPGNCILLIISVTFYASRYVTLVDMFLQLYVIVGIVCLCA